MYQGNLIIAICGDAGSGKDTAAFYMKQWIPYSTSTSYIATMMIWEELSTGKKLFDHNISFPKCDNITQFHGARTDYRGRWVEWISGYNRAFGESALYRASVAHRNYILTGIRRVREIDACLAPDERGVPLVDLAIWLKKDTIKRDGTQEFGPEKCHIILDNNHGLPDLKLRCEKLARMIAAPIMDDGESHYLNLLNKIDEQV